VLCDNKTTVNNNNNSNNNNNNNDTGTVVDDDDDDRGQFNFIFYNLPSRNEGYLECTASVGL